MNANSPSGSLTGTWLVTLGRVLGGCLIGVNGRVHRSVLDRVVGWVVGRVLGLRRVLGWVLGWVQRCVLCRALHQVLGRVQG
jgi:hypothetical protein